MPRERHGVGDATGARSGPLAKIAVYYTAHLARRVTRCLASDRHHLGIS